jgi:hypothetical protein
LMLWPFLAATVACVAIVVVGERVRGNQPLIRSPCTAMMDSSFTLHGLQQVKNDAEFAGGQLSFSQHRYYQHRPASRIIRY